MKDYRSESFNIERIIKRQCLFINAWTIKVFTENIGVSTSKCQELMNGN